MKPPVVAEIKVKKTDHDHKMILESEAFRALNQLIDQHLASLKQWEHIIEDQMKRLLSAPVKHTISIRTYEEIKGYEKDATTRFQHRDLEQLSDCIASINRDREAIGELLRYKLRLLNDYDFTHGDNTEQLHVFGPIA